MQAAFLSTAATASSGYSPSSTEIAPGVFMPFVNMGGVHSKPTNYSLWLDVGGLGLDTARTYGDDIQQQVGAAIAASGLPRSQIFVTSKVPCCPASFTSHCTAGVPANATADANADLSLLGLDYIDLMLLHWPCDRVEDSLTAYRQLEQFAMAGKARAIGVSNFNSSALDSLFANPLNVPPAINQCGFSVGYHSSSPYGSDLATLAACKKYGVTYSAYSPLGGLTKIDVLHNADVVAVANAHNKTTAQIALRWVVQQGVVAVSASTEASYDKEDLEIFDFELSDAEMDRLMKVGLAGSVKRTE